jgi:hypothetical protein
MLMCKASIKEVLFPNASLFRNTLPLPTALRKVSA